MRLYVFSSKIAQDAIAVGLVVSSTNILVVGPALVLGSGTVATGRILETQ